jgi:hypothetical protein
VEHIAYIFLVFLILKSAHHFHPDFSVLWNGQFSVVYLKFFDSFIEVKFIYHKINLSYLLNSAK